MVQALELKALRKTYGSGLEALKGIDLSVRQGDFFALLGPNGAGKSTTLGIVSGLVNKTSGSVKIFGFDMDTHPVDAKSRLGVVPQEFNFNQFEKVFDIVVTQAGYYGIPARIASASAEKYLRKLGLWEKRDSAARLLSGGMKRRLMIARALVHEPALLILDEPTAGVDIELRRSMWEFMNELNAHGTTIILTTHYLEEAEALCRNIAIIDKGVILENTSKKALLGKLNKETYVIDVVTLPEVMPVLPGAEFTVDDEQNLVVTIDASINLNRVFAVLSAHDLVVRSMRTRSNRLEELFVEILGRDAVGSQTS
ncbi:MAG: ABC transporter ATP-binding protein [Hahellaceae bacterium]|nr:ABC transporter ATP-binding protein [Hahellaceae bacterium]